MAEKINKMQTPTRVADHKGSEKKGQTLTQAKPRPTASGGKKSGKKSN